MKKRLATHLQRAGTLLDFAKGKADRTRIRWKSEDLGPWSSVNPQWSILKGRLRFQFQDRGRLLSFWAVSIRQKAWGISVSLADPESPLPVPLELVWDKQAADPADPGRVWKVVKRWLNLRFPGHRILRATRRQDLSRTLSGSFLRVLFSHQGEYRVLIAAEKSFADESRRSVGQALLWLSTLFPYSTTKRISTLYVIVPHGASGVVYHRCRFLNKNRIRAEVWEYGVDGPDDGKIRRAPAPSPPEEDKDFRWPALGPFRWSSQLQRVLDLAPEFIRRYPRFQEYDSLRLWGLEFAQVHGVQRDRILFGIGPQRMELSEGNFDLIRAMVEEIVMYRRPDCPDTRHPYYRLQAERWLEALVLEGIPRLFPEMAPKSVYSQIPVYLGKESGRIDILGADRQGTLVVMELKVVADPDLPIQALDYWGRVIQHNENGDFEHRGYFSELRLRRRRPKIYLVSPVFSFHDTTECLLDYLEPGLDVWKISINEDWRYGVKIIRRTHYKIRDVQDFTTECGRYRDDE